MGIFATSLIKGEGRPRGYCRQNPGSRKGIICCSSSTKITQTGRTSPGVRDTPLLRRSSSFSRPRNIFRRPMLLLWIVRFAMILCMGVLLVQQMYQLADFWFLFSFHELPTWTIDEALFLESSRYGRIAIFYNVYVPNDVVGAKKALHIVEEQINQIGKTYAVKSGKRQTVFLINTIGSHALDQSSIDEICRKSNRKLQCRHVRHYFSADETVTLDLIQDYCRRYPDNKAVYLHSKGSYHDNAVNARWRRILTEAATSEQCIDPPGECNLCGLQFFTQWTTFMPGNMWAADCSYINKLLPTKEYNQRLEEVTQKAMLLRLRDQLKTTLLFLRKDFFGLDRYGAEHWVGSHPDVQPCDMDTTGDLGFYFEQERSLKDLEWSKAPRHVGAITIQNTEEQELVNSTAALRIREYFYLPGNLLKWTMLYGEVPGPNSWAWKWFPDGDLWKEASKKYGLQVVDEMTKVYYRSADGSSLRSAFAPKDQIEKRVSPVNEIQLPGNFAVFYHIATPQTTHTPGVTDPSKDFLKNVEDQLRIVANSRKIRSKIPVFCNTFGSGGDEVSLSWLQISSMCSKYDELDCHPLRHYGANYEGETLRQLHSFCQSHPHHRVAYIHNTAPVQVRNNATMTEQYNLVRHLTMAAVSAECAKPLASGVCNVCGLVFFTAWMLFYGGNMFTASCAYVNELVPPTRFEQKMEDFVGSALLMKLKHRVTTEVFEDRMDCWGIDKHSAEHWIASHPSILPCDLTPDDLDLKFWAETKRSERHFSFGKAPRHGGSPYIGFDSTNMERVMSDDGLRLREYNFLAGNLMKWYSLYGEVPPASSWVWSWFPDGEKWRSGAERYGKDVVNVLTGSFSDPPLGDPRKKNRKKAK